MDREDMADGFKVLDPEVRKVDFLRISTKNIDDGKHDGWEDKSNLQGSWDLEFLQTNSDQGEMEAKSEYGTKDIQDLDFRINIEDDAVIQAISLTTKIYVPRIEATRDAKYFL
ncbi:hypothetical protein R1flu_023866 [Riccia fluitans]|uniref:Uncharacterized protein n=1 Tax=Riccia fluitans TaxID=41844 RepID=A0ABD1XTB7_9MARC